LAWRIPENPPSDQGQHPLINNTGGSGYNNNIRKSFSGKFSFDLAIPWIKGLSTDGYYFYTDVNEHEKEWSTPWTFYSWDKEAGKPIPQQGGYAELATLEEDFSNRATDLINFRIKYESQFEDHYINTFLAAEQSKGLYKSFIAFRRDFMAEAIDELFAGSDVNQRTDGSSSENARRNFFGRLSYNFKEKYLLDFNFRYDGSYRFPKDGRWGFFPGVSVAYRISEESFLKDKISFIDNLKIRASYGEMGNDAINPFQFLQSYNLLTTGAFIGEPTIPAPVIWGDVAPNPNVTWEVATVKNIGLDALIFNSSLELTVDVFKQRRSNILTTRALEVPKYTGLILPAENIGIVDNKGIELTFNHRNTLSVGSGLSYRLGGNVAFARNKVVDVSEAADVPEHQKEEGHVLGAGLYYQAIGIFRTQEEVDSNPIVPGTIVGDLQYNDYNGDGEITANDRVRIDKSIHPEITYGFNASADYKNFSLYAQFSGVARAWWWLFNIARPVRNAPAELLENRYTPGSMDSKYPWIPTWHPNYEVSGMVSDFWLEDASFLRLKTLELSYILPQTLTSKLKINRMRVYLSGSNLFTISDIKDYDPEGANTSVSYATAYFYPQTRVYNLGVQLTF
jgi:TonB-dependent starch-binding outer membrane protein SusC